MQDLKSALGLDGKEQSLSKSVQTCPKELKESEALFKQVKAGPTQAIIESLPAIMERIARGLESVKPTFNPHVPNAPTPDPRPHPNRGRKPRRGPNPNRGRNNNNQPRNQNDSPQ